MAESTATAEEILEARRKEHVPGLPAGWRVIAAKEFADHLLSFRFLILLGLLGVIAMYTVYAVSGTIRDAAQNVSGSPLPLFLFLFAGSAQPTEGISVSFVFFVGLLGPLLGIAFGFDAVSAERSEGTLPRLVSQPIHRDDVVNGKFVAGLSIIALIFAAVMLLIAGVALVRLGVTPTEDEVLRILTWFVLAIVYVGFWLAFATLCSVAMRRAATSALVALGVWIGLTIFGALLVGLVTNVVAPLGPDPTVDEQIANVRAQETIARISPSTLYEEATIVLLNPSVRSAGSVFFFPEDRAVQGLLSLDQSLLLIWPQIVALVALTVISFAAAYVLFLRQEVRA